jgi:antirestriction protein ArdC
MSILKKVNIRLVKDQGLFSDENMSTPTNAVNVMKKEMAAYDREVLCVVNLNSKLKPLNFNIVSVGGINYSQVSIANVFKSSILSNASSIMVLHNHPSHDPTPSKDDDLITQKLVTAGKLLSIPVTDHIIIGSQDNIYSYYENNRLKAVEEPMPAENKIQENHASYNKTIQKTNLSPVRQQMADEFLKSLKQNVIPWQKAWKYDRPVNATNEKNYKGVNSIWLSFVANKKGYEDPRWCTFKQAKDNGWFVKKGEKGTKIEFWSMYDLKTKKKLTNDDINILEKTLDSTSFHERIKPISSTYIVFNASQMTGIPPIKYDYKKIDDKNLLKHRDIIIKNMGVKFDDNGNSACYIPAEDKIILPNIIKFKDTYSYMTTFFHEAAHASGHGERLKRDLSGQFGSEIYAREELRAEIASSFASQILKIPKDNELQLFENNKAYIKSWISILQEKPNELFRAIAEADVISDYLLQKGEFNLKDHDNVKDNPKNLDLPEKNQKFFYTKQEAASIRLALKGKKENIEIWKNDPYFIALSGVYKNMQQSEETMEELIINHNKQFYNHNSLDLKKICANVFAKDHDELIQMLNLPDAKNEKTFEYVSDQAAATQFAANEPLYYQTTDGFLKRVKTTEEMNNIIDMQLNFVAQHDALSFDHVYCVLTEHQAFNRNTSYTVSEFDSLMKDEDNLWLAKKTDYMSKNKEFNAKDPNVAYLTCAEIVYDVYSKDKVFHEKCFIGDGEGGVINHFRCKNLKNVAKDLEKQMEDDADAALAFKKTMTPPSANITKKQGLHEKKSQITKQIRNQMKR